MAATLANQQAKVTGVAVNYSPATAGGDTFDVSSGAGHLRVKNGAASAVTVTIADPANTRYGLADPAITASVPAGAEYVFGPLDSSLSNATDGLCHVTYSSATSVTVAYVLA